MSRVYCDGTCKEAIDLLLETIIQACTVSDYDCNKCGNKEAHLDSMALRTYADAMTFLEKQGLITIESQGGRRVIAKIKENKKNIGEK